MGEEINPALLQKTQEILGSVIKKPPLTDKNLKRPPFRFLHDIITNVIKTTGFMKGLYSPEEMQSENVKDKETKMAFLQKAVDVLALSTNQTVNVKATKVVSGHDAEKTNIFLQMLGTAIKNKIDSKEAVRKVLDGSSTTNVKSRRASVDRRNSKASVQPQAKPDGIKKSPSLGAISKEPSKNKDGDKTRSRSKDPKTRDKEKPKEKSRPTRDDSKSRAKIDSKSKVSKRRDSKQKMDEPEVLSPSKDVLPQNGYPERDHAIGNDVMLNDVTTHETHNMMNGDITVPEDTMEKPPEKHRLPTAAINRPPSARNVKLHDSAEGAQTMDPVLNSLNKTNFNRSSPIPMQRPPSARPSSSRPAPPRIRVRHIVDHEEPRPLTAKPVENVIVDQKGLSEDEDDEDEAFVIEEEKPTEENLPVIVSDPQETPEEDKGSLVKQLLETKKDLEGGSQIVSKKVEIDKSQMTANKMKEASHKELIQLRLSIQNVSKTAHPLGRMLDYLQEDIDSMNIELRTWKDENKQNLIALKREKNITESILEPLRAQLDDYEQLVQDQLDANSVLKATILRNEERIQKMVSSLNRKS